MNPLQNAYYRSNCLKLLERLPDQSVDFVYIDPPWNQTPDFVDADTQDTADEIYKYFMRIVFRHVRRVLSPDGNLMIHISSKAGNHIRPLMYEMFSEDQFRPEINLSRWYSFTSQPAYQSTHDQILRYAMSDESTCNQIFRPYTTEELNNMGYRTDDSGEYFRWVDLTMPNRPGVNNEPFRNYELPEGCSWRYAPDRLEQLWQEGKIEAGDKTLWLRDYLEDKQKDITNDWNDPQLTSPIRYSTTDGTFTLSRPVALMEKLIGITTDPGDTVLDVFSGLGTRLAAAHRTGRRWIGCEENKEGSQFALQWLREDMGIDFSSDGIFEDETYLVENFPIIRKYGKFFLSYSSKNREEFLRPFHETLLRYDIDHWWDQKDIPAGSEWAKRIDKGLEECDAVIVFITPDSMESKWVRKEYKAFIDAKKTVFPVRCIRPEQIPDALEEYQHTRYAEYETKLIPELLTFNPGRLP